MCYLGSLAEGVFEAYLPGWYTLYTVTYYRTSLLYHRPTYHRPLELQVVVVVAKPAKHLIWSLYESEMDCTVAVIRIVRTTRMCTV